MPKIPYERPSIPRTAIEIYGVVRGIPLCFDDESLKKAVSNIPILSIQRFTRKDTASDLYLPTTTDKLGFKGDGMPKYIIYEYN